MGLFGNSKEKRYAQTMAPQWLKIAKDCANIINTTTNPDVFFDRYDLLIETMKNLASVEKHVKFSGSKPSDNLREIVSGRDEETRLFLNRAYEKAAGEASKAKTETGRANKLQRFLDGVGKHGSAISVDNRQLLASFNAQGLSTEGSMLPATQQKHEVELTRPNRQWEISVSFGSSSSQHMPRALHLAQSAFKYEENEFEGSKIYQAWFRADKDSFLNFVRLYEIVEGWKSTAVMVNGELVDRKIIGGIKYCYGDKCRNGRDDFCFGASQFTENPFGCHRLQISTYNNPWWTFGQWSGNTFHVDKPALRNRIEQYSTAYRVCPDFMYDDVMTRLEALPAKISRRDMEKIQQQGTGRYLK